MSRVGRILFGAGSLSVGIAGLALHDQLVSNWPAAGRDAFLVATSFALGAGGVAVAFRATGRIGAVILGVAYLVCALTFVPEIVAQPAVYASYGDVFYQLAPFAGAVVACGLGRGAARAAVLLFGLCCASFAIEQIEFLARTASLVPAWVPPNGTFWTIATTVAFGLAAIALVSGYAASLAARATAAMFAVFTAAVWVPILIADPRTHANWSEGLETLVTTGAAWIVAESLATPRGPRRDDEQACLDAVGAVDSKV